MNDEKISLSLRIILTIIGLGIVSIIGYAFYLSLTLYSYFIIGRDEANFLLRSSMAFFSADTWRESVTQLFQVHGQHVLLGMQLANLLSFLILDSLDFQFINFIGLLYLVIPALLICSHLKIENRPGKLALGFLLAAAIIFPLALSPAHISCAINTACTGNHYLGFGLAVIALYIFIPSPPQTLTLTRAAIAEIFVLLAILSSPASLVMTPLLFAIIFFFHPKKLLLLTLHGLASFFILSAYFYIAESADFSFLSNLTFQDALQLMLMFGLFFFNTLGSVFFWPEQPMAMIASVVIGIGITTVALWQIKKHWHRFKDRTDLLFFASGFFLALGMIGLIALGRLGSFGSSRFVFYGCFALVFLLLFLIACRSPRLNGKPIVIALLCLLYYPAQLVLNQPYIERIKGEIIACNHSWYTVGRACGVMMKHAEATELLLEAERQGILKLPKR